MNINWYRMPWIMLCVFIMKKYNIKMFFWGVVIQGMRERVWVSWVSFIYKTHERENQKEYFKIMISWSENILFMKNINIWNSHNENLVFKKHYIKNLFWDFFYINIIYVNFITYILILYFLFLFNSLKNTSFIIIILISKKEGL